MGLKDEGRTTELEGAHRGEMGENGSRVGVAQEWESSRCWVWKGTSEALHREGHSDRLRKRKQGYDAIFFASKGIDAIGMDLSSTAVDAAREHHSSLSGAPSNVTLYVHSKPPFLCRQLLNCHRFDSQAADFFAFSLDEPFSLAYDFTFFCAIPPSWRQKWGDRYAEVIRKDGVLITLQYPIGADSSPSFASSKSRADDC